MLTKLQSPRVWMLLSAAAIHVAAIAVLDRSAGQIAGTRVHAIPLTTVFIRPEVRADDGKPEPDLSRMIVPASAMMPRMQLSAPLVEFSVSRNSAATIATPSLRNDSPTDLQSYVVQAALLPGEGATVVLRVEVLETGEPGSIAVEVSSGSRQTDQAAIAYAHSQRWNAGLREGMPQAMWIRWSVRLQA